MRSRWLRWFLVVLCAALIFHATASPAYSGARTRQVVSRVISRVLPAVPARTVAVTNVVVRKSGHVLAFGTLTALVWWALPPSGRRGATALALTALYAATDERHQSFVPGRSAEVTDVFLDTAAAVFALAVIRFWAASRRRRDTGPAPDPVR